MNQVYNRLSGIVFAAFHTVTVGALTFLWADLSIVSSDPRFALVKALAAVGIVVYVLGKTTLVACPRVLC